MLRASATFEKPFLALGACSTRAVTFDGTLLWTWLILFFLFCMEWWKWFVDRAHRALRTIF